MQKLDRKPLGPGHSQMMAIMELKFPMLKHSRATSIKNSSMRVRCFFFTTLRAARQPQGEPTTGASPPPPAPEWRPEQELLWALGAVPPRAGEVLMSCRSRNAAVAFSVLGRGAGEQFERIGEPQMNSNTMLVRSMDGLTITMRLASGWGGWGWGNRDVGGPGNGGFCLHFHYLRDTEVRASGSPMGSEK